MNHKEKLDKLIKLEKEEQDKKESKDLLKLRAIQLEKNRIRHEIIKEHCEDIKKSIE